MRIALLGAGRIGRMHAPVLVTTAGVDRLVIADANAERATAVATEVGARAVRLPDEALDEAAAVGVPAATDAHVQWVGTRIRRGLPRFCEKPLAPDLEDSLEMTAEIEASSVPFQLGFQRRFDPGYREARRLVQGDELGTLYAVRMAGHDPEPPSEEYIAVSGGLFRDFSVHDFDILRWLTGQEVEEVSGMGAVRAFPVFARHGDVDTAVATLRLTGGTLVAMTVARHDPRGYDIRTELFGPRDSVSVGLGPQMPIRSVELGVEPPAGPAWSCFMMRFAEAYRREMEAFVRVAPGEAASECGARDGVEALRVAEAATRSMQRGTPVRLAEIPGGIPA
jgi:myo-inositol 2-dehydrogenase/D-chiro-inositol 1-dehydrogenase